MVIINQFISILIYFTWIFNESGTDVSLKKKYTFFRRFISFEKLIIFLTKTSSKDTCMHDHIPLNERQNEENILEDKYNLRYPDCL